MVRVRRMILPAGLLAAVLAGGGLSQALAQDTPPVLPPQQPNATQVPEKIDPPIDQAAPTTGTLSDQLDKSEGVIKPPAGVDPEMHVPAPGGGSGVVIPPPGSSPDDSVQPK